MAPNLKIKSKIMFFVTNLLFFNNFKIVYDLVVVFFWKILLELAKNIKFMFKFGPRYFNYANFKKITIFQLLNMF